MVAAAEAVLVAVVAAVLPVAEVGVVAPVAEVDDRSNGCATKE